MTNNTIKTLSTSTVTRIAEKLNCTATKAELIKQFKAQPEAVEKAYNEAKTEQSAEAEPRRQAKAEEMAKRAEAIAKAEEKQKQGKQGKTKEQKQKQGKAKEQKTNEQKQKRAEAQAEKKEAVVKAFTLKDIEIREDSKKNKYTLFYNLGDKSRAIIEIFVTAKEYHICSKVTFKGATYHESWGFKYDNRYSTIAEVKQVYKEILEAYKAGQKQKAEAKKQKEKK
jgi:hypothetical protein